jgi:hypothetical protein
MICRVADDDSGRRGVEQLDAAFHHQLAQFYWIDLADPDVGQVHESTGQQILTSHSVPLGRNRT